MSDKTISIGHNQLTGHAGIDSDHIEIANIMNAFYQSLKNQENDGCRKAFGDLLRKLDEHFTYEKNVMIDFDYPDLEAHKKSHQESRARIAELWRLCQEDLCQTRESACHELRNVVVEVIEADKAFGQFIRNQGIPVFIKL